MTTILGPESSTSLAHRSVDRVFVILAHAYHCTTDVLPFFGGQEGLFGMT